MMDFNQLAKQFKTTELSGRYICLDHISPLLLNLKIGSVSEIGFSVLGLPIHKVIFGIGKIKILMWSQMHGNESTTTKAVFDFFNFLELDHKFAQHLKANCTFCVIPMLNPDGAVAYTRENANGIDLNRDAQNLSQPESLILRNTYLEFTPDYCYNLHDQRSIYGAGNSGKSACMSFLAPAYNDNRDFNISRTKAIRIICDLNSELQKIIPGNVGRFDDGFNLNCVGDTFQNLGTPTILFEAGHFQNDYNRDYVRELVFISLVKGVESCCENDVVPNNIIDYLAIPQNKVNFYDIIYNNVKIIVNGMEKRSTFAVQFSEVLIDAKIEFVGILIDISTLNNFFAHLQIDAENKLYESNLLHYPIFNEIAHFSLGNRLEFNKGIKIK